MELSRCVQSLGRPLSLAVVAVCFGNVGNALGLCCLGFRLAFMVVMEGAPFV